MPLAFPSLSKRDHRSARRRVSPSTPACLALHGLHGLQLKDLLPVPSGKVFCPDDYNGPCTAVPTEECGALAQTILHAAASDFSKVIGNASLITPLPCLNLVMTHCPAAPKSLCLIHPASLPTSTPHPTLHSCQTARGSPDKPRACPYVFYLECSLPPSTWLIPNYLSDFRVDMSSSRKPPLTLKTRLGPLG